MAFTDLVLLGDDTSNYLVGMQGNDRIAGRDGDDNLDGGSGNDFIWAGRGNDFVDGGNGHDTLYGGEDDDTIIGANGRDWLSGDAGFDTLSGGNNTDTFSFNVREGILGVGWDTVTDFVVGTDKLEIFNGAIENVTFNQDGADLEVYYDGVKIAELLGVTLPGDPSTLFGTVML